MRKPEKHKKLDLIASVYQDKRGYYRVYGWIINDDGTVKFAAKDTDYIHYIYYKYFKRRTRVTTQLKAKPY